MIESIKKYGVFTIMGLFSIFFQPPVFSFNIMHIVGILSIFILASKGDFGKISYYNFEKKIYIRFIVLLLYMVLVVVVNSGSAGSVSFPIFYLVDILPFAMVCKRRCELRNCKPIDLINTMIFV